MKKIFLSLVLCAALVGTQGVIGNTAIRVKADTSYTSENLENDYVNYVNVIVDASYEGESGTEVNGVQVVKTIQEALDLVPNSNSTEFVIYIKNGTYKEKLTISKSNVTLIGEDAVNTVITYDDASGTIKRDEDGGDGTSTYGTGGSPSVNIKSGASNFSAINLTIENSFDEIANSDMKSKQAVAMMSTANQTMFVNCRFIGNQDTLCPYTNQQYYYNCYIEGDVDFIFGNAQAVFENCELHSVDREGITPKGYVTAPNTSADSEYGYLFLYCDLTSNITEPGTVYLGRPWHDNDTRNSSAVFKYCTMGSHIAAEGWTSMSGNLPEDNRLYEYGSTGEGAIENENRRVLIDEEAAKYTKENVLVGWDTSTKVTELNSLLSGIKSIEDESNTEVEDPVEDNTDTPGDAANTEENVVSEGSSDELTDLGDADTESEEVAESNDEDEADTAGGASGKVTAGTSKTNDRGILGILGLGTLSVLGALKIKKRK